MRVAIAAVAGFLIGLGVMAYVAQRASECYLSAIAHYRETDEQMLATCAKQMGDYDAARGHYESLVVARSGRPMFLSGAAEELWTLGFPGQCALTQAIGLGDRVAGTREYEAGVAMALLANALEGSGKPYEATEKYETAAKMLGYGESDQARRTAAEWGKVEIEIVNASRGTDSIVDACADLRGAGLARVRRE